MKVLPFKIPKPKNEALVYQIDNEWVFYDQLHQHAEIQISFIERGTGTLLVGDTINEYLNNFMIGSSVGYARSHIDNYTNSNIIHNIGFSYSFLSDAAIIGFSIENE